MSALLTAQNAKLEVLEICEVRSKYPKQWVTVDITEFDDYGWAAKGRVVLNSKRRSEISKGLKNIKGKLYKLYTFYTGSIDDNAVA